MKNLIFCLLSLRSLLGLEPLVAQAQPNLDSLQTVWRDGQAADSSRFQAHQQLTEAAPTPEAARSWLRQLVSWAETQAYREAQVWAWQSLARSYNRSGNLDSARSVLEDALTRTQAWQDAMYPAKIQMSQAALAYQQGNFAEADRRYQAVIDQGPPLQAAAAWKGKGNVAYRQAKIVEAKSAYLQALRLQQQMGKEANDLGGTWYNLALAFMQLGQQDSALLAYAQARAYAVEKQEIGLLGYVYHSLAGIYSEQGNYPRALACADSSLKLTESSGSLIGQAQAKSSIGMIYLDQGEEDLAVAYTKASLALYQQAGEQAPIAQAYNQLGNVWSAFEQPDSALVAFQQSLEIAESLGLQGLICGLAVNIGNVYRERGEHQTAISYLEKGLALSRDIDYQEYEFNALGSLMQAHNARGTHAQAAAYSKRALVLVRQLGLMRQAYNLYDELATTYEAMGRPAEALSYYRTYVELRDSLKSEENQRAVIRYEFEKQALADSIEFAKQAQIKDLQIAEQEASLGQQRIALGAVLVGLTLIGALAYAIFRGKKRSDELLLNILPAETAAELKATGAAAAKEYERVSILFSDFIGFTQLAERFSAAELVAEINVCFKAFDEIMTTYGLEKIKTIGDAYMAAGGLPDPLGASSRDVVHAGLAMQQFITQRKVEREAAGRPFFEMRVGIHTGPVIAGVVGIKKFQYDVWGDTVNVASRMESNGAVGEVNISAATHALLQGEAELSFEARGAIEVKGKGQMQMYFVRTAPGRSEAEVYLIGKLS